VLEARPAPEDQALAAIERVQTDAKRFAREVTQLKTQLAARGGMSAETDDTVEVAGVKLARRKVTDLDKNALRGLADSLKAKIKSGVVLVASSTEDGKASVVVSVTPDLTTRIPAGQLIKALIPIVGGGGGGRADFAEAGGKNAEKLDELLRAAPDAVQRLLDSARSA
jgi:alanyl-tRNA synthetase